MRELFNDGWKFSKISIENKSEGGKTVIYNPEDFLGKEEKFSEVTIPHDYLISNTKALYENSVGFYRKSFNLSVKKSARYYLRFGGVYMNWALFVNGKKAGEWKYGYSTVEFEVTPFLKDGLNEAEVICVYQCPNTRWYSGAGIFRDVYFVENEDVRFVNGGTYFNASKKEKFWTVNIKTEVEGEYKNIKLKHSLTDENGNELDVFDYKESSCEEKNISPAMGTYFDEDKKILLHECSFNVENPLVWDVENPHVYTLTTMLIKNDHVADITICNVGFRTIKFDCNKGLFLNDNHLKIYGVCQHHDFGGLGSAFNIAALRRQFLKLKEMGVNAIRTSHNPQDEQFLNLADEMGFLICNECFDMWEKPKTTYDYGNHFIEWHERDCSVWVRRDRNHPSLLMWSIGNEIYDTHSGNGYEITKDLKRIVRKYDPEKNGAVTIGSNYMEWDGAQHCAEEIDLAGYNYGERLYADHHKRHPSWCIYGSETSSTVQSRGIYHFPLSNRLLTYADNQCSSLGNCSTNWGAKNSSIVVAGDRDTEFSLGQFIWTGWDYIGEPTPYSTKNSYFGQIDTAGFEKDTFYAYKAGWVPFEKEPFIHLLPYWDFNENQLIDVRCFTNASSVELFVNGKSLGIKKVDVKKDLNLAATWEKIPYHKGQITAVAYDENGKECCRDERKSFGNSRKIILTAEKYCDEGLYFIDVSTVDENNVPCDNSRSRIFIKAHGNDCRLLALDNGDSTDIEQYVSADGKTHNRKLFGNRLVAIVKSEYGNFTVTAESPELEGDLLEFKNGKVVLHGDDNYSSIKKSDEIIHAEIPVRKIELECDQNRILSPLNKTVCVNAKILPENATCRKLKWEAMMLEGVSSDCAELKIEKTSDGEKVYVNGISDGAFRLTCYAYNETEYPEVVSELEFSVEGIGKATRNPYKLIEACKCSESLNPVQLSFEGGAFTKNEINWFSFDKVDFGNQGSDCIELPIFSFDTELPVEVWDGIPENGGRKILDSVYKSPSVYNTYQSNSYVLNERLFGIHTITLLFKTGLSIQGFKFTESRKAFAKLRALDCNSVVGDTFVKTTDAVKGIGNNVVLQFDAMDFGDRAAKEITICGYSHVHNTIHVKFCGENGDVNRIVEFPENDGWKEMTFPLDGVKGMNTVSFVFLPGSNFDFKYFMFK